jgi:hypothetical protein
MDIDGLALKIAADPTSFESSLLSAEGTAQRWAKNVETYMGNVKQSMDAVAAHPIGAAIFAVMTVLNTVKSATSGAYTELVKLTEEGNRAAASQSKLVRQYGLSAEEAAGFSVIARKLGLDTGEVASSMTAFQRHLGDAASGNAAAAASFQRLGLDANQLAKLPVADAMFQVGESLKALPPGLERTSAAYAVLTRRGAALLPIILQGQNAFAEAEKQAKRWGLTFTASELEAIRAASIAQKEANAAVESVQQGIANRLAVAFAPLETGWAKLWTRAVEKAEPILKLIRDGIDVIGEGVQEFMGGWLLSWKEMEPWIDRAVADLKQALAELGKALGLSGDWKETVHKLGELLGGTVLGSIVIIVESLAQGLRITKALVEEYRKIPVVLRTSWVDVLGSNRKAPAETASPEVKPPTEIEKAAGAVAQMNAQLHEQIATFGMTQHQSELYKFGLQGVSAAAREHAKALMDVEEAQKRWAESGRTVAGQAEQYRRLVDLMQAGKITADEFYAALDAVKRARANALAEDLDKTVEGLRTAAITAGMTAEEIQLWKLRLAGANEDQLAFVGRLQDAADAAKQVAELKSPFEKWQDDAERLTRELEEGSLTADQYADLMAKRTQQALQSLPQLDTHPVAGLSRGSAAAINAINTSITANIKQDPMDQLLQMQKEEQFQRVQARVNIQRLTDTLTKGGGIPMPVQIP